jgi:hypothetical protein
MTFKELKRLSCKQDVQLKELKSEILNLKPEYQYSNKPIECKKGDIYFNNGLQHPVVMIKKIDGKWWGILITSSPTCDNTTGIEVKHRFSNIVSYYTKTILEANFEIMKFKDIADIYNLNKALRVIRKSLIKI